MVRFTVPTAPRLPMSSDYVDFVLDALADWHTVTGRRMFGGYGLFRQGVMFALIIDETLYFKVDGSTRPAFEQAGSTPLSIMPKASRLRCHIGRCRRICSRIVSNWANGRKKHGRLRYAPKRSNRSPRPKKHRTIKALTLTGRESGA